MALYKAKGTRGLTGGHWVTIKDGRWKGQHVYIKDNQTFDEAIEERKKHAKGLDNMENRPVANKLAKQKQNKIDKENVKDKNRYEYKDGELSVKSKDGEELATYGVSKENYKENPKYWNEQAKRELDEEMSYLTKDAEEEFKDNATFNTDILHKQRGMSYKEIQDMDTEEYTKLFNEWKNGLNGENKYKTTKRQGFGEFNNDNIPVYDNKIDYTGDFTHADLSKLSNEELTNALNKQTELYKEALGENVGDQRTRNGKMFKMFNDVKKMKYENGTNKLLEEMKNRGMETYNIYNEKNGMLMVKAPTKEIADRQLNEMLETDKALQKEYGWKETPSYKVKQGNPLEEMTNDRVKEKEAKRSNLIRQINKLDTDDKYKNLIDNASDEELENLRDNLKETAKRDKLGQNEYLMQKQRERGIINDEKSNELQDKANNVMSNWRDQIKANNDQLEKDLENYKNTHDMRYDSEGYYELFRENERKNAKIKREEPNEKYEFVEAYAGYKAKRNKLADYNEKRQDEGGNLYNYNASWTGKEYTNDEFMEHLEDSNWHKERRMLEEAHLTNKQLSYIKDRTNLSMWSVGEELTGEDNVRKMINEAKKNNKSQVIDVGKVKISKDNNVIPKDFTKGYGKFKVETSASKDINDIYEITKDDYGYHAKNTRTGETFQALPGMLRNKDVFEFTNEDKSVATKSKAMKLSQLVQSYVDRGYSEETARKMAKQAINKRKRK